MSKAALNWEQAPAGWDWAAQDADGKWYWYSTQPILGIGGGVWRSNSRHQQFAYQAEPNPNWHQSLCQRPDSSLNTFDKAT